MQLSRREFLKAAAAIGLTAAEFSKIQQAVAGNGDPPVIWLQGQGCTGCSVSFLNSVYYATVDSLLLNTISLEYHATVMAAAGDFAISAASVPRPSPSEIMALANDWLKTGTNLPTDLNGDNKVNWLDYALLAKRGYILVVEGAIPTGSDGLFCTVGGELTMLDALRTFSQYASAIIAVGTCGCYGGISAGAPNTTAAKGVKDALAYLGISKPVINIPGCPVHPDWLVGTLSYFLVNGAALPLDASGRPLDYFRYKIHDKCPLKGTGEVKMIGQYGCLQEVGCRGEQTYADCYLRKWNSPAAGQYGVNWCIGARTPCHGCTQPNFPDGMSPFYKHM